MKMPAAVKLFFNELIKKVLVNATGFKGWILTKVMQYGGQLIYDFATNAYAKIKRFFVQKEAKEKHEKVVNDPNSTVDERGKAYEDRINTR